MIKRQGNFFLTAAKARIKVGKSFCRVRRPMPTITGSPSLVGQGRGTGSLAIRKIRGVMTGFRMIRMSEVGSPVIRAMSLATP